MMRLLPRLSVGLLFWGCAASSSSVKSRDSSSDGDAASNTEQSASDTDPADTQVYSGLLSIGDLEYLGAFRVSSDDFGVSNSNYAVGTLGFNPKNHSLFLAGHAQHNAVAEFPIPTPGLSEETASLPLAETPLQPFTAVLDAGPHGNPDEIDRITGLYWMDGSLIVNAERWYDAGGEATDTTLVVRDADRLDGAVDGWFELDGAAHAGGYLGPIPEDWRTELGGTHLTGWASNYSIISRYSIGPSLFAFDPTDILDTGAGAEGPISTRRLMDFPHADAHYLGEDALLTEEGSAPALWNFLSRAVFGRYRKRYRLQDHPRRRQPLRRLLFLCGRRPVQLLLVLRPGRDPERKRAL